MSTIDLADRTRPAIAGEKNSPSETFLLQADAGPDTSDRSRLERLHRLIRQHEMNLLSSPGLDAQSSAEDEDAGDEPGVLIEATTTRDGEVHSHYLFEDLKVFMNSFSARHLNLLRAARKDGPIKPETLARQLGRDLSEVLGDVRNLAFLGLIDETRRGVRVEYDELTMAVRADE
jgi:predicted transcriptional regulator